MGAQTSKYHTVEFDEESYYIGELNENNEMSGEGKFVDEFGNTYIGYFSEGKFNGYVEMNYTTQKYLTEKNYYPKIYQGNWKDNCKHGFGVLSFTDGSKYEGNFYLDNPHGKGKLIFENNHYFIGNFHNGQATGYGTMYDNNSKIIYQGNWVEDLYDGFGKLYINNFLKYKGQFVQGYYNGIGTIYFDNGNKNFKAEFKLGIVTKIINKYHKFNLPTDIYKIPVTEFQDYQFINKIETLDKLTNKTEIVAKPNPIAQLSNKIFLPPTRTPDPSAPVYNSPNNITISKNKYSFSPNKTPKPSAPTKSPKNIHSKINPLNIFI